jgi:hypothetical protein
MSRASPKPKVVKKVKKSPPKKSHPVQLYQGLFQEWCDIEPSDCEFMYIKKAKKSPVKKSPVKKSPVKAVKPVKKSPKNVKSPVRSPVRKSPPYHAKDFKVGQKMKGVDGNMWKIIVVTKNDGSTYKRWSKV